MRFFTFKSLFLACVAISSLTAASCTQTYGHGTTQLKVATGSPGELGLVKVLSEAFSLSNDAKICWIKAGSGESLSMLKNKEVDLIMVHAPKAEKDAIKEGWASDRTLIGSNEFYIVGPKKDPAHIQDASSVVEAYSRIAARQALFYTRADNSGTHKKELDIWKKASITPQGKWYETNKDFMLATLKKADTTGAYFMTDSSTWVAAKKELKHLIILFHGDPMLINTYNALKQNGIESKEQQLSQKFIAFIASKEGQDMIRTFGKDTYGEAIYNDAQYAKKYDK